MLCFRVGSGSGESDDELLAVRASDQVRTSCKCKAAENGMPKERFNLPVRTPKKRKLTSGNPADVSKLRQWLVEASLGKALSAVTELDDDVELKVRLPEAKKALSVTLVSWPTPSRTQSRCRHRRERSVLGCASASASPWLTFRRQRKCAPHPSSPRGCSPPGSPQNPKAAVLTTCSDIAMQQDQP
ncbi:hypothetical protein ACVIHI_000212 [Bradyrhizobium sp. USDA 4524]|nr:hypothetical protein [Bradyrhizobium sp. USDA 4538]MCP1898984.1 hypothetical protein [Bradyrhizobium sp. USDA 4537]MCP1986902.1 hypothetical protein [Bradyrhizobium sp. USDA 4539]